LNWESRGGELIEDEDTEAPDSDEAERMEA
jgi:hypothetical protein